MSRMSEVFTEMYIACTWNEDGIHFTEVMNHWDYLESVGLIQVRRPIDKAKEHWTLKVTALGQNLLTGETK